MRGRANLPGDTMDIRRPPLLALCLSLLILSFVSFSYLGNDYRYSAKHTQRNLQRDRIYLDLLIQCENCYFDACHHWDRKNCWSEFDYNKLVREIRRSLDYYNTDHATIFLLAISLDSHMCRKASADCYNHELAEKAENLKAAVTEYRLYRRDHRDELD